MDKDIDYIDNGGIPPDLFLYLVRNVSLSKITNSKKGLFKNREFFKKPPKDIEDEVHLFRAVLDRALVDYVNISVSKKDHKEALGWVYEDNPDFVEICDMAFLEPSLVYKTFKAIDKIVKKKKD